MREAVWILAAALAVAGCGESEGEGGKGSAAPPVQAPAASVPAGAFAAVEADILVPRCAAQPGCHTGTPPAAGLDLSAGAAYGNLVGVKASRRPERLRVAAGNPEGSYLLNRVLPGGDTPSMPLGGEALSAAQIETLRGWIREGAKR